MLALVIFYLCLRLVCVLTHIFRGQGGAGGDMKLCGLKCLLLQGLRAGGYSNKGFLSIGASDALIKPDHRTQSSGLCARPPGLGGRAGTGAETLLGREAASPSAQATGW